MDARIQAESLPSLHTVPNAGMGSESCWLGLDNIFYYVRPAEIDQKRWEDVPETIKNTFDKLGIPEAEQKFLSGVGAQYDSEMIYHSIQENLEKQGVIFLSIENGLKQYPDCLKNILLRWCRYRIISSEP